MTNLNWTIAMCGVLAIASLATAAPLLQEKGNANAPVTAHPFPEGAMQQVATTACTECHDTSIILQQRLSKAAWTKEVDKMMKWGAVVDAKDHDPLVDYFSANFGQEKPAYEPPRTMAGKNGK